MKQFIVLMILPVVIFAKIHYAKVEPYDTVTIKAAVSGQVIEADSTMEAKNITNKRVVHIDDVLDHQVLLSAKESLKLLQEMRIINQELHINLQSTTQRHQRYYEKLSKLNTASQTQKDNAFSIYTQAKTQSLGVHEKLLNLQKQILDMQDHIAQLEDAIAKKSLFLYGEYLYKLMVRKGDFVAIGTPLAVIQDTRRAKLTLFLDEEELRDISNKKIYIDSNQTDHTITKIWQSADEHFISSYRVEIVIPAPVERFSALVKVELK